MVPWGVNHFSPVLPPGILFSFMYRLPTSTLAKWCSKEFAWRVALNGCFLDSKLSWQDHILFCWRSRRCLRLLQACISWGSHWKMHYLHITLILSTFNYGSYSASASLLTPWYNPYCCLLCISRCLLILQLRSSIVNQGYHPIFDIVLFSWRSCAHFHQFSHSILSSYLCLPTLSLLIRTLLNLFTHSSSHILSSFCPNFPSQYQCLCRWP